MPLSPLSPWPLSFAPTASVPSVLHVVKPLLRPSSPRQPQNGLKRNRPRGCSRHWSNSTRRNGKKGIKSWMISLGQCVMICS